jgi:hypothetical protein
MNLQFIKFQCLFVQFPSETQFKILTNKFEVFCETFHIIGKIDGSHISILATIIGGEDYYCFLKIHPTLLQQVVDTKCMF